MSKSADVDLELDKAVDLSSAIHQTVGFASMCWLETPKGVFDSDGAHSAANQLEKWIEARYIKKV